MKYATVLAALASTVTAFPAAMQISDALLQRRAAAAGWDAETQRLHQRSLEEKRQVPSTSAAVAFSKARTNCGVVPCLTFNAAEQYVSNTGDHAYASPGPADIRGPCPGLNAASNHGYLSRNGVSTIADTVVGLGSLYNMSPDLAGFLAAYAILFDGDPVLGTWSIGGPPPSDPLTNGILGQGQGISWSHNIYEGDSSIARNDAYLNGGDAHSLNVDRFRQAYAATDSPDRYTLDSFAQDFEKKAMESEQTNPYYFTGPFSTTLVSPAAYNFVINFMSNRTAEQPGGYLDGAMFKQFFGIVGDSPENFQWIKGQESIPDNWYKRTASNQYNAANVFMDLGAQFAAYPDSFRLGGNTNGPNTYAGISLSDFTGGVMNLQNLQDTSGVGGACFAAQFIQSGIPDPANQPIQQITPIAKLLNSFIKPITGGFDCPIVDEFDQSLFNKYPGHTYSPTGPATNY